MNITDLSFGVTDWSEVERTEHSGEYGVAYWKTRNFGDIRVRMVEYSPGYLADHWCAKGHILLCLEGELLTELDDGRGLFSRLVRAIKLPTMQNFIVLRRSRELRCSLSISIA
ncbi:DHCW motif cupin fold protein [Vreelandella titanicae]|uniref:DHCW motif cupin fold protein n=1 Tax=Vreelandella titanicae TaxID=664683 RepID=UPI001CC22F77|nr:DHCW motif cupin fold protein [Halomonas titanicae]